MLPNIDKTSVFSFIFLLQIFICSIFTDYKRYPEESFSHYISKPIQLWISNILSSNICSREKPRTGVTGLIWSLHKCTLSTPGLDYTRLFISLTAGHETCNLTVRPWARFLLSFLLSYRQSIRDERPSGSVNPSVLVSRPFIIINHQRIGTAEIIICNPWNWV